MAWLDNHRFAHENARLVRRDADRILDFVPLFEVHLSDHWHVRTLVVLGLLLLHILLLLSIRLHLVEYLSCFAVVRLCLRLTGRSKLILLNK